MIFTFAEGNIAIAAACAPLLASQWNWTVQKIRSSLGSQYSSSSVALKPRGAIPLHDTSRQSTTQQENQERLGRTQDEQSQITVKSEVDLEWARREMED